MGAFTMPSLGADMDAGTVTHWLAHPGDEVHRGDVVAVVETDKSAIEVEVFEDGVMGEPLVAEGTRVPVGTVLADIAPPRAPAPAVAPAGGLVAGQAVGAPSPEPAGAGPAPGAHSPVVRRLAQRLGVDLGSVTGTGPAGAVTRADVERAAAAVAAMGPAGPAVAMGPAGPAVAMEPAGPAVARVRSSPLARRLAAARHLDLAAVPGTGPGGSVVERDVLQVRARRRGPTTAPGVTGVTGVPPTVPAMPAPAPATPAPAPGAVSAPGGAPVTAAARQQAMRRAIGELMARSKRQIPHYYLSTTVDVGTALDWLGQANAERPVPQRLVLSPLLLKATAMAVRRVPEMNGFFADGGFTPARSVHLGVAISLRTGGVLAPAIHDADRLSVDELMAALRDLVGRTRQGMLRASEMSDPTITVTNLGDLGVEAVFGVIYPPQVALVGFGRVTPRPWAQGTLLGVRPCVTATVSADHRVSDGHRGARFLAEIDRLLQRPEEL